MSLVSTAARPHPDRLSPALYPVRSTIEARFGDMDANRHLNNLALEAMHENARATLNTQVFPGVYTAVDRRLRLVTANNVVHFLRESHWPGNDSDGPRHRTDRTDVIRRLDGAVHRRRMHQSVRHRAGVARRRWTRADTGGSAHPVGSPAVCGVGPD
jgi:hypothetical protein